MTISFQIIQWVVLPTSVFPNCGLEEACTAPLLTSKNELVNLAILRRVQEDLASLCRPDDRLFWKKKLMVCVGLSENIVSVTFIPKLLTQSALLFIQKSDQETGMFVAPYLSEDEQRKWNAVPQFPKHAVVSDETSARETIKDLKGTVHDDIETCLIYFLNDTTTCGLGLTYLGPDEQPISCGWIKS